MDSKIDRFQEIVAVSDTGQMGSHGWRHRLMWRQLSLLWKISVSHQVAESFSIGSRPAAYSVAVSGEGCDERLLAELSLTGVPVVVFLDRVRLKSDQSGNHIYQENHRYRAATNSYRHYFRVEQQRRFVEGVPEVVSVYGERPEVTSVAGNGTEVLISLDGIPIIGINGNYLLIGADPWQFGIPSVPMLYKVLSNWLTYKAGCVHQMMKPYAAIRIDDLPTTAEELKSHTATDKFDKNRARKLRRLRKFAQRAGAKFSLMYSSHFRDHGQLKAISFVMPRSIKEIQSGVAIGVFQVGSHGMVHLRGEVPSASGLDPREFIDLSEQETVQHLTISDDEIARLFRGSPQHFVAPAWGYRPGVTKSIAGFRYSAVIDSSQHVENGECDVFMAVPSEGTYFNMVETFRPGARMLTYSNPDFWRCFAGAGIPIHYMQHTDTNWHILTQLLKANRDSRIDVGLRGRLLRLADDPGQQLLVRAVCAALLTTMRCMAEPACSKFVWQALTRGSIYSFGRAMKAAGYSLVTLSELETVALEHASHRSSTITGEGRNPHSRSAARQKSH
jgi:peptidoglycan/xylan/chitin deacetylase (PgdA/CDA1 family)